MTQNDELDITKLKYVLYVRKSTDDPQRQVRSLDDQIDECLELADRLKINVVNREKPFIETKSAKTPNIRKIFDGMLNGLQDGEYDAILAWNPDRLARNMLEAGKIIDMADTEVIKDFKFVTHVYSPDANGKMLLGMAFVLSKQYSDKLSQDVTRGVGKNFQEGKTPAPKYGYVRDKDGYYRPDGKNFDLVCEAWKMRAEGVAIIPIVEYMNSNGFYRIVKESGKKQKMTQQKISKMFKNPFYYGLLIQVNGTVDMRDIYNFKPATSVEEYAKVQSLIYKSPKTSKPHKNKFYPFRMMIFCNHCGSSMRVAPVKGQTKRYLMARCDNKSCIRNIKKKEDRPRNENDEAIKASVRTKFIVNFILEFVSGGLGLTENEYPEYLKQVTEANTTKREKLKIEIHSRQAYLKKIKGELKERALGMHKIKPKTRVWKINMDKIASMENEELELERVIEEMQIAVSKPEQEALTLEQFLNLSKNAGAIIKKGNAQAKDLICRLIFANFYLDYEKVASYQLNEPFATLLKDRQFLQSRGAEN